MSLLEKLARFARKPSSDQWVAIKATYRSILSAYANAVERRRFRGLITGAHALPRVLQTRERLYIAYRPDSDVHFKRYPEITQLSDAWVKNNIVNNAGDLPRPMR